MLPEPPAHLYSGAHALILLHEHHLRRFVAAWKRASAANLELPSTRDEDYVSLPRLLRHVMGAARGYMVWSCEVLNLPEPAIEPPPGEQELVGELDRYLEHVLEGWRTPLAGVDEERFHRPEYPSRWKVNYCVDAMLEHAVMHPVRHEFQLSRLLGDNA